jgi:uncharacterized repeat protein (TIGR03803 family)
MTAKNQSRGRISWTSFNPPNTALLLAAAFVTALVTMPAQAVKVKVLYTFTGGADGGFPNGSLIEDAKGNLYGTAELGGNLNCAPPGGCGTVYKLTMAGKLIVLHTFMGGTDGASPYATLLMDAAGNLYGTTSAGGGAKGCFGNGCGTVFKISPKGKETVLYRFQGKTDGGLPYSTLIGDKAGNLYGTTSVGGNLSCANGSLGCGTVFKMSNGGKETVLYTFTGSTDGAFPQKESLAVDSNGNFYGTTSQGGNPACNPPNGCGTVFKLAKTGKETVLHAFTGASDGQFPESGPILIKSKLYGTAAAGGAFNLGTVYSMNITLAPDGFTNLHDFKGAPNDGARPEAAPTPDVTGIIVFLLTGLAGVNNYGAGCEQQIAPPHKENLVLSLDFSVVGAVPQAAAFYSLITKRYVFTTSEGGNTGGKNGAGTIVAVIL